MVLFSFGVFYGLVVNGVVRRIWSRFSVREDRVLGIMATVFISLVVSLLAVVVGEMWADWDETLRIGYGHLSYRGERIPWSQHHAGLFAAGLVVFWILSLARYARREGRSRGALGVI